MSERDRELEGELERKKREGEREEDREIVKEDFFSAKFRNVNLPLHTDSKLTYCSKQEKKSSKNLCLVTFFSTYVFSTLFAPFSSQALLQSPLATQTQPTITNQAPSTHSAVTQPPPQSLQFNYNFSFTKNIFPKNFTNKK